MTDNNGSEPRKADKVEAIQVISGQQDVKFTRPGDDIYTARMPISGCDWVETDDGVVLIDTLLSRKAAGMTYEKIREVSGNIRYIIYTHGHVDHINGCSEFMADKPEVIASKYLPERLDKYRLLARHRARIAAQQFNLPEIVPDVKNWVYPTRTFLGEMTISLGGKTFELHTARAETDDACWVWVPEIKTAFIGDLIIRSFPNIGNPWKPTRFTLSWAKALEEIRAKEPEMILASGLMHKGKEAQNVLDANIEAIRSLHDQVVECINKDMHITEMIHTVKLPEHLQKNPHLQFQYSRPEFFVFNTYRWYHGYFDHNPAHLLPRPEREVNAEIYRLINGSEKILNRTRELLENEQAQLALEVLDVLLQAESENIDARKLRIELLEKIGSEDYCLMSRNSWVYFINMDKEFLRSKGAL